MIRKILCYSSLVFALLTTAIIFNAGQQKSIDNMPVVEDDLYAHLAHGALPIEKRDSSVRKWLAAGVRINVGQSSGSGTIIYFNESDGYAYVQSCGHLWGGNMSAEQGVVNKQKCKVTTWYHNEIKLSSPKTYTAEVLYYSNTRGQDCSLIRFKPDWVPNYFAIVPEEYQIPKNQKLHSIGCDSGQEIADYDVRYLGLNDSQWPDLFTTENSPRPGRSGGGLLNDDFYLGICWGTTNVDGSGNGLFTPIKTVRYLNKINGFGWLNEAGNSLARKIPIIDRNNPQGIYPKDYVPLPKN